MFLHFRKSPPHSALVLPLTTLRRAEKQKIPPRDSTREGMSGQRATRGGGCAPSGRISVREDAQATLRCGVASAAFRFAMNAARREPRAQGMTVSFSAAAFVIDLIKRAFVFICSSSVLFVALSVLPC